MPSTSELHTGSCTPQQVQRKGRLHYGLLLAHFSIGKLTEHELFPLLTQSLHNVAKHYAHYSEASSSSFFCVFFFKKIFIHELTWHLGTKSQPSKLMVSFLRFSSTTYSRCFWHFWIRDRQGKKILKKESYENTSKVLYCIIAFSFDSMVCLKPQLSRS